MAVFGRKRVSCPACDQELDEADVKEHFKGHVQLKDGGYTWECCADSTPKHWDESTGAWDDLMLHMQRRHGISVF